MERQGEAEVRCQNNNAHFIVSLRTLRYSGALSDCIAQLTFRTSHAGRYFMQDAHDRCVSKLLFSRNSTDAKGMWRIGPRS